MGVKGPGDRDGGKGWRKVSKKGMPPRISGSR